MHILVHPRFDVIASASTHKKTVLINTIRVWYTRARSASKIGIFATNRETFNQRDGVNNNVHFSDVNHLMFGRRVRRRGVHKFKVFICILRELSL